MATYYSQQAASSVSTPAHWNTVRGGGGSSPASFADLDADSLVIQPAHVATWDGDASGWANGIASIVIEGHATTPGMLTFPTGDGQWWLKVQAGGSISGTNATLYGRIMTGAGTWGSPAQPGIACRQVIEFAGTSAGKVTGQYLTGQLVCTEPTNKYVEVYKTAYGPVSQATNVTPADDYIDWGTAPPVAGTPVKVRSTGTLPAGLTNNDMYYVRSVSGNKCKLALQNADAQIVDITSVGTGNITLYDGHTDTATKTLNVLQDVRTDWTTDAGYNRVCLVDIGPADADTQLDTLATINAGSVVLTTANVDSAQYPLARLYLCSRNVQIISNTTSGTAPILDLTSWTGSAGNGWYVSCGIVAVASNTANRYGYGIVAGIGTPGVAPLEIAGGTIASCARALSNCTSGVVSGGAIVGCSNGLNSCVLVDVSGGNHAGASGACLQGCSSPIITGGEFCGNTAAIQGCISPIVQTGTSIHGCTNAMYNCLGLAVVSGGTFTCCVSTFGVVAFLELTGGSIRGASTALLECGGHIGATVEFRGNAADIALRRRVLSGDGTVLPAVLQVTSYKYAQYTSDYPTNCTILDLGGVAEAIGSWCPGGFIKTNGSMQHVLTAEDNRGDVWVQIPIRAVAGRVCRVTVAAQLSGTAAWTSRPTFAICDPGAPWKGTGELLDSEQMANNTDPQTFTLEYTPAHDRELVFLVRACGGNTSGTGTETCTFTFEISPGGGGAVAWGSIG